MIKVLIIDDSALTRDLIAQGLKMDSEIEVVGTAKDPYEAREKIISLNPDVLTLDVEMPGMNGLEFLKQLLPQYPIPVVMVSSLTSKGSEVTIQALNAGAVDFVIKPNVSKGISLNTMMFELIQKVKTASNVEIIKIKSVPIETRLNKLTDTIKEGSLIAVGASTGGTQALTSILRGITKSMPPILVVQHMPTLFTKLFAERLNQITPFNVCEAKDGDRLYNNTVYIAPGGFHLRVKNQTTIEVKLGAKVNNFCPSVDVLFESVASIFGKNALGLLLTGMGNDGAKGLLKMRQSGARCFAQDKETSVVFGMPGVAYQIGAVDELLSLDKIPNALMQYMK